MKKIFLLIAIFIFAGECAYSQTCITDVWMTLTKDQIVKAKKLVDECMVGNEKNADAWLMKANVYLRRYQQELEKLQKDPDYVIKDTGALWIANESFYKALELNPKIEPKTGMIGALRGQILIAEPLFIQGQNALENGDLDKAFKYLERSAKNFRLDSENKNVAYNVGLIYMQLAQIAETKKDAETYIKMLQEGINVKTPIPDVYLAMYDVHKANNDTVKCGAILKTAKRYVPDSMAVNIYGYEMDYFAMTGESKKLNDLADTLAKKFDKNAEVLGMIADYLNNSEQFEKAEMIINQGLQFKPDDFDLNQRMGYRYFFEAVKYQNLIDKNTEAKKYAEANTLREKQKEILEKAHIWAEKAYNLNSDDRQNNLMLRQIKTQLLKPIPEDLKAKCDSYQHR